MHKISAKIKLMGLLMALLLMFGGVYIRLVQPTLKRVMYVYNSNDRIELTVVKERLKTAKLKLSELSASLGQEKSREEIQHYMINFFTIEKTENGVMLNNIYEPHVISVNGFEIVNQGFEIKGDFKSMVKMVNDLEKKKNGIIINTVRILSKKNRDNNKYGELFAILYVQSVTNESY